MKKTSGYLKNKEYVIGLDFGGSYIRGGVIDNSGKILFKKKILTEALKGKNKVVFNIKNIISDLIKWSNNHQIKILGIGIGSPGPLNFRKGIILNPPNLKGFRNVKLKEIVEEELNLPVVLDNDADCALLGEIWQGVGQDKKRAIMLTLGTGIGGAVLKNGKIFHGGKGSAELGHQIIDSNGPYCKLGDKGCLEAFSSGTAILRDAKESAEKVFIKAKAGNKSSSEIMKKASYHIALGIKKFYSEHKPEIVVLSGGMSKDDFYIDLIKKQTKKILPIVLIKKGKLGDDAGIIGAAKLVFDKFR